jgi:hypothetical protein
MLWKLRFEHMILSYNLNLTLAVFGNNSIPKVPIHTEFTAIAHGIIDALDAFTSCNITTERVTEVDVAAAAAGLAAASKLCRIAEVTDITSEKS